MSKISARQLVCEVPASSQPDLCLSPEEAPLSHPLETSESLSMPLKKLDLDDSPRLGSAYPSLALLFAGIVVFSVLRGQGLSRQDVFGPAIMSVLVWYFGTSLKVVRGSWPRPAECPSEKQANLVFSAIFSSLVLFSAFAFSSVRIGSESLRQELYGPAVMCGLAWYFAACLYLVRKSWTRS